MRRKSKRAEGEHAADGTPRTWLSALVFLGVAALGIRLSHLYELRQSPFFSILIGDSLQYDSWARRIAAGDWIGNEVFYQSPLYPYLMAVFYRLYGIDLFALRLVQAVLGALSCVLLALAGRRFFDARAGLIAGGMLAIYPPAIFYDALIQKSSLDLFLITLLLWALGACVEHPKSRWLALAGVALGALALNRENARVLFPVVAGWLFFRHSAVPMKQRASWVAIFAVSAAAVLAPVALRNRQIGGEWLLSTSQFGPNFYIGNHRGASGGYDPLVSGRGNAAFEREDATRLAEAASGRTLSPGEVSDYWRQRALAEIRESPGRWLRLMARKAWLTVSAGEPVDTESIEAYSASSRVLRLFRWLDFGIVMALAVFGAWITRGRWRSLSVLYVMFAVMAMSVVMFFVLARYRFPLVPIAMLFAGAGMAFAVTRRIPPHAWRRPAIAAVVIALLLHIPVRTSSDETYVNYGSELLRQGRPAEAVSLLREAVKQDPAHKETRLSLGLALQQTGNARDAAEQFQAAVALDPASSEAQVGLAITLHQQGRVHEAIKYYEEAVRLKPASVETMSNLGLALNEAGRPLEAIGPLERAVALQPQNLAIRMNLCQVLADIGRGRDAVRCLEAAAAAAVRSEDVIQTQYALAQAQVASGQVMDAVASLERALTAARAAGDTRAIDRINESLRILRSSGQR